MKIGQISLNQTNIKLKLDELDKEIMLLENKISEISWQRKKYQQFFENIIKENRN